MFKFKINIQNIRSEYDGCDLALALCVPLYPGADKASKVRILQAVPSLSHNLMAKGSCPASAVGKPLKGQRFIYCVQSLLHIRVCVFNNLFKM